jgi:hypothetical protein
VCAAAIAVAGEGGLHIAISEGRVSLSRAVYLNGGGINCGGPGPWSAPGLVAFKSQITLNEAEPEE